MVRLFSKLLQINDGKIKYVTHRLLALLKRYRLCGAMGSIKLSYEVILFPRCLSVIQFMGPGHSTSSASLSQSVT